MNNYKVRVEGSGFEQAVDGFTDNVGVFSTLSITCADESAIVAATKRELGRNLAKSDICPRSAGAFCKIEWWELLDASGPQRLEGFSLFSETGASRFWMRLRFILSKLQGHSNFFSVTS